MSPNQWEAFVYWTLIVSQDFNQNCCLVRDIPCSKQAPFNNNITSAYKEPRSSGNPEIS